MAPHSSTLAWKIPWMEEPGRLQSVGSLRVGHAWATSLSLFTFMHWRRKWQPTPVFLPGESQRRGEPGGLLSMGSHSRTWLKRLSSSSSSSILLPILLCVTFSLKFKEKEDFLKSKFSYLVVYYWFFVCMCVKSPQSCPTLCDPMDSRPPGSSVYGILQERILESGSMPSSSGSSGPRYWTWVSWTGRWVLYH